MHSVPLFLCMSAIYIYGVCRLLTILQRQVLKVAAIVARSVDSCYSLESNTSFEGLKDGSLQGFMY